ncbi:MAG: hypothetical protein KAR11_06640 [Phycisphaerae bacterium]|nr:hypothetical protein [Phycisphaerae bacterium]
MIKNNENLLIVVLLLTAGLLGIMVVSSLDNDDAALAYSNSRAPAGRYIMLNGKASSSQDIVYIIDVPNQKLMAYSIDAVRNRVLPVTRPVNLATVFRAAR